jgi:hypothetical protein
LQKKSGAQLISAKVQTHPGSSEIGKSLHKIQKITLKVCPTKRELIYVSQVVYYLCGMLFPAFNFPFYSCLTKKPDVGTPKMKKKLSVGQNKNCPS